MRRGVLLSVLLHLAIVAFVAFGLPKFHKPLEAPASISVALVQIADKSAAPPAPAMVQPKPATPRAEAPKRKAEPEPPKAEASPPAPPPTPKPPPVAQKQVAMAPPPAPTPEPAPKLEAPPPPPKPEPRPEPKPEPQAKNEPDKPKPAPEKPKTIEKLKEAEKPKKDEFADMAASLLKDLRKSEPTPKPPERKEPDRSAKPDFEDVLKAVEDLKKPELPKPDPAKLAAAQPVPRRLTDGQLTMSEEDALRRQIEGCWNVPAGAKGAPDLIVEVTVRLNPDGSVRDAAVVPSPRLSDPFYRSAAESAVRAVRICSPLKVPPEKYSSWKEMTLTFNPKDLLG